MQAIECGWGRVAGPEDKTSACGSIDRWLRSDKRVDPLGRKRQRPGKRGSILTRPLWLQANGQICSFFFFWFISFFSCFSCCPTIPRTIFFLWSFPVRLSLACWLNTDGDVFSQSLGHPTVGPTNERTRYRCWQVALQRNLEGSVKAWKCESVKSQWCFGLLLRFTLATSCVFGFATVLVWSEVTRSKWNRK